MKKVLFIQPHKVVPSLDLDKGEHTDYLAERTDKFARAVPSIPAMCVLGALDGHETYFIDLTADNPGNISDFNEHISLLGMGDEELCDKVNAIKPDVVLLTSIFTTEYFAVNHAARVIKDKFELPIVVGGNHATLRPEWHIDYADIVVLGEGELNINEIINGIEGKVPLSQIKGIVYKKGREIVKQHKSGVLSDLDQRWDIKTVVRRDDGSYRYPLSIAARNPELYLPKGLNLSQPSATMYASRGCFSHCDYCNATTRDGKKIRHMSLEKMIGLTEEFIAEGANTFYNQADVFGTDIDREFIKWFGEQREQGSDIYLINNNSFFARFFFPGNKFSSDRIDLLKKAGFKTITVSLESFNEKFNNGKLKDISVGMLDECFGYMKEQGLGVDVYMMYLFPEQTEKEFNSDRAKIEKLSDNITTTTWRSLTYFPGTVYYDWAIKTGKFTEEGYRKMLHKGHSFYHADRRFNFSRVRNPPLL